MYVERLWSQQTTKRFNGRACRRVSRRHCHGSQSENRQVISISDIAGVLDIQRKSAKDMAYALKEKGWLERIAHGKYLILPLAAGENAVYTEHEFVIASALVEPMYIGYWSALNHHGLTEQMSRTVYVVTTERAQEREIHGVTYRPVTVTEQKFFGYQPTAVGTSQVNISSIERRWSIVPTIRSFAGVSASLRRRCRTLSTRAVRGNASSSTCGGLGTVPQRNESCISPTSWTSIFRSTGTSSRTSRPGIRCSIRRENRREPGIARTNSA